MPPTGPVIDTEGRVRLDTWELDAAVQAEVDRRWQQATTDTTLAYLDSFHEEVQRLYGFAVPDVDYTAPAETDIPCPQPTP